MHLKVPLPKQTFYHHSKPVSSLVSHLQKWQHHSPCLWAESWCLSLPPSAHTPHSFLLKSPLLLSQSESRLCPLLHPHITLSSQATVLFQPLLWRSFLTDLLSSVSQTIAHFGARGIFSKVTSYATLLCPCLPAGSVYSLVGIRTISSPKNSLLTRPLTSSLASAPVHSLLVLLARLHWSSAYSTNVPTVFPPPQRPLWVSLVAQLAKNHLWCRRSQSDSGLGRCTRESLPHSSMQHSMDTVARVRHPVRELFSSFWLQASPF